MDVYRAIKERRSIRAFKGEAVPREALERILEAARLAPSARNRQEWRFLVISDEQKRKALVSAAKGQEFVGQAPLVLVFCSTASHVMSCGVDAGPVDAAIALSYVTLSAVAEGLGTCWLGAFYQDRVREILGIPEEAEVIGMTPLGYPDESPAARPRRSPEEVISYDGW